MTQKNEKTNGTRDECETKNVPETRWSYKEGPRANMQGSGLEHTRPSLPSVLYLIKEERPCVRNWDMATTRWSSLGETATGDQTLF